MYSPDGVVNQVLQAVGLGSDQHAWLGDFSTALPAVGIIGTWVVTGFCTVLLLVGIAKIDQSLFEAARLDGAGRWREFRAITLPGLRREIVVCVTVTIIAALASFDVVYISTQGGPGLHHDGARASRSTSSPSSAAGGPGIGAGRRAGGAGARHHLADPAAGTRTMNSAESASTRTTRLVILAA